MACLASVSRVRCTIYCVLCRSVVQTLHCVLHTYCVQHIVLYIRASFCSVGTCARWHSSSARCPSKSSRFVDLRIWAVLSVCITSDPRRPLQAKTLDIVCRCRLPAGSFQRPCIVVSFWRYDAACSFVVRTMITSDLPRAAINDQRTLFVFYSALPSYILGQ